MLLKKFSENSWLIETDDKDKIGLLTKSLLGFTLTVNKTKLSFQSEMEINKFLGEDIFYRLEEKIVTILSTKIDGYPTNYKAPLQAFLVGKGLPVFSKKENSKVYYAAGYYCVRYNKGWVSVFCPKVSTLDTYEYIGPFYTEADMKIKLKSIKKDECNTVISRKSKER